MPGTPKSTEKVYPNCLSSFWLRGKACGLNSPFYGFRTLTMPSSGPAPLSHPSGYTMIATRLLFASILSIFLTACASLSPDPKPYPAHQSSYAAIEADIAQARENAIADGTLLMLVLGANWCHDSALSVLAKFSRAQIFFPRRMK